MNSNSPHPLIFNFKISMRIFFCLILLQFYLPALAQDNWIGIEQTIDVKKYPGKRFRYTANAKTDGSPNFITLMGARELKAGGQTGYFNHGGHQPVWHTLWTRRTLEGILDSNTSKINIGMVIMGKGTASFDAMQLEIETAPGTWLNIPVINSGFESSRFINHLPEGWSIAKPAPGYTFSLSQELPLQGSQALSITGFSSEDSPAPSLKRGALIKERYMKSEFYIPMRDGTRLFTAVYIPQNYSPHKAYPILLHRTPYTISPYGKDNYPFMVGPSSIIEEEGYIFVHQDVRGRYKSEGNWTNLRPHIEKKSSNAEVDESTDTWDTIEWLIKNISNNNGRVGQWGISYPGFFASAGSIDAHPALKAVSPQAPVADFWFDDIHHNGAFTQAYFPFLPIVGTLRNEPTQQPWFRHFNPQTNDSYDFFLRSGNLRQVGDSLLKNNFLWREIVTHPDYDTFWKARRITDYLKSLKPAYLVVGGWFDAEDLYGTLTTYKEIEKHNKGTYNILAMGPFGHGDWARETGPYLHHQIYFGDSIATFYQSNIEARFFRHFLKGAGDTAVGLPEAYIYNTGRHNWQSFSSWPPPNAEKLKLFLDRNQQIRFKPPAANSFSEYISDPLKPVPFTMDINGSFGITPRNYMSEDQRFAARRPDVLVFETDILEQDLTLGGEITVNLHVSTTGTDADWIVKLIDVYPGNKPNTPHTPKGVSLGGYQQLVRGEVMRSRWRKSFEKPEPMKPDNITTITFKLQDVLHTFKKGHRLMVQVQSTWFPLIDINPQKFVPNIYKAEKSGFIKATHRVYHGPTHPSYLEVDVLK